MRPIRTRRRNKDPAAPDREKRNGGTEPPETEPQVIDWSQPQPGPCNPKICGQEAACSYLRNNTHLCICAHDGSPPTADRKCPIRITVPITPRPIYNVRPPIEGNNISVLNANSTTAETTNKSNTDKSIDLITVVAPASVLAVLLLFILCICCWKWKSIYEFLNRKNNSRKTDAPRTGEPLLAERYIANPQYSSAYNVPLNTKGPTVPLLQKNSLTFIEEIGEGCFGKVYKGILKVDSTTSTMVAIKMLKDSASRTAEEDFIREVNIMSVFKHINILTLIGILAAEDGLNPSMVFEFMPFGDLVGVLRSNSPSIRQPIEGLPPLDNEHLLIIALQIARGMEYLAAQRFVHRDLACRNCLVGENLVVKIADFGMSRDVYTSDYYRMAGNRPMPIRWMSPESIQYQIFTLESDVWSYGVVLWEIYSLGKQPYYGHNNEGARKLILQGIMLIPPEHCPTFVCELMRSCWRSDSKDRINFEEICTKLQNVYNSGGWDESTGSGETNANSCNAQNNKNPTESDGQTAPGNKMVQQSEQTDSQGYLVPLPPVFREYLTALPD